MFIWWHLAYLKPVYNIGVVSHKNMSFVDHSNCVYKSACFLVMLEEFARSHA